MPKMFLEPIGSDAPPSSGENAAMPPMTLRQKARVSCACAKRQLIPTIAIGVLSIGAELYHKSNICAFAASEAQKLQMSRVSRLKPRPVAHL